MILAIYLFFPFFIDIFERKQTSDLIRNLDYLSYYNVAINKLAKSGVILADNTLWSGKIIDEKFQNDEQTKGVMQFNNYIKGDTRIEKVILPVRDGLTIIRKI